MKHHQITSPQYRPAHPIYYVRSKHLANTMPDVISVAVLAVILVIAHYLHL